MDLDKQIHTLIKLVSNVTDAYTTCLFWLNEDESQLTLRSVYTMSKTFCRDCKISMGVGIVGWVARQGKAINASPFKRDPKTLQLYKKEENIKSFLAVPVKVGKETRGVLCVDSKKGFYFTPKMEKILHCFADYFSDLILAEKEYHVLKEQAHGYLHLYNLYKELNGFHKENIFELLINISRQLFTFEHCILAIYCDRREKLDIRLFQSNGEAYLMEKNYSDKEGIAGLIIRTKKPLLLSELQERSTPFFIFDQDEPLPAIGSFMGLPLLVDDEVIGILGFTSAAPKGFVERDLQVASVLSFQASSNISLARAHERARQMDTVDALTGLATHSLLHGYLEQAFKEADKHAPFSLLLLDIDNFHQLNRKYSYQVGDVLLKKTAHILTKMVRDDDVVARFGGEEFCILLHNSHHSRAKSVADRIRHTIQQTVFVVKGLEIKFTVSMGIATYLENAISKEELLSCAKAALTEAQRKKNTVV